MEISPLPIRPWILEPPPIRRSKPRPLSRRPKRGWIKLTFLLLLRPRSRPWPPSPTTATGRTRPTCKTRGSCDCLLSKVHQVGGQFVTLPFFFRLGRKGKKNLATLDLHPPSCVKMRKYDVKMSCYLSTLEQYIYCNVNFTRASSYLLHRDSLNKAAARRPPSSTSTLPLERKERQSAPRGDVPFWVSFICLRSFVALLPSKWAPNSRNIVKKECVIVALRSVSVREMLTRFCRRQGLTNATELFSKIPITICR